MIIVKKKASRKNAWSARYHAQSTPTLIKEVSKVELDARVALETESVGMNVGKEVGASVTMKGGEEGGDAAGVGADVGASEESVEFEP